jgi:hypothetical protein
MMITRVRGGDDAVVVALFGGTVSLMDFPLIKQEERSKDNGKNRCCPISSGMIYHDDRGCVIGRRILLFRRSPGNNVRV